MRVCVYCGSSSGRERHVELAAEVGRALAGRGFGVVYGGGRIGLMGTVADAALEAGTEVVGVIPQALVDFEVGHRGLTELRVVDSMHERKALMAELSDAFIALPGGAGTVEEVFEVWTWAQLGLHAKPVGLLNFEGYYDHLVAMVDHMVTEGFLKPAYRQMLLVAEDIESLLDKCAAYEPPDYTWTEDAPLR